MYRKKVHGDQFDQGDLVWLHNPVVPRGQSRKLHCPWTGPFKVVKRLSDAVYRIQDTRPKQKRSRIVVHYDRLKPCASNAEPQSELIRRRESKEDAVTPRAHGINLNVDMDDDEDADHTNGQGDPIEPRQCNS